MTQSKQNFWGERPATQATPPAPRDDFMTTAARVGARTMHTEDLHEVICFRPEALREFVRLERERCAKLAEMMADYTGGHGEPPSPSPWDIASAIREGTS